MDLIPDPYQFLYLILNPYRSVFPMPWCSCHLYWTYSDSRTVPSLASDKEGISSSSETDLIPAPNHKPFTAVFWQVPHKNFAIQARKKENVIRVTPNLNYIANLVHDHNRFTRILKGSDTFGALFLGYFALEVIILARWSLHWILCHGKCMVPLLERLKRNPIGILSRFSDGDVVTFEIVVDHCETPSNNTKQSVSFWEYTGP